MRLHSLLLTLLAAAFAVLPAKAEPYTQNFDASTSLPEGWEHVGGTFYTFDTGTTYYMNSDADYARSKRNSLCCPVDLSEEYLVTPKVTGQVSLYMRAYRSKRVGSFRIFRCSDDGQTLGEEITTAARSWTSSNTSTAWQQVTFNLGGEGSRLALKLNRAYVDDFSAELYEEKEEVRALSVLSVESLLDTSDLLGDDDNHVTLSFRVTLKNVGNVDLTPEEENYTVSLLNADGYALFTQPIADAIAAGETAVLTLERSLTANALITGSGVRFAVRENFTQTEQYCPTQFTITAYLPQLLLYDADPATTYREPLTYQNVINYGNIAAPLAGTFYIKNAGNAPLVITSITAPESFVVTPTALTVAAGQTAPLTITLDVIEGQYGYHEGDVIILAERIDEVHLTVKGTTRDPENVYIDFNDQHFPQGWTVGEGWRISNDFNSTDYYAEQYRYPATAATALVSPKLEVREGEALQFLAKAYDSDEAYRAALAVSYSADRTTWTRLVQLSDTLTEDFQTFVLDTIPAGQWYLRFEALNAAVDNIWGFRLSTYDPQLSVFDADPAAAADLTPLTTGAAVDFGSVAATTSRTFYLQNTGTGTLSITSVTAPEGFAVAPAELELTNGEAAPITVSLLVGTDDFGPKSGTLRIEGRDIRPFELALSGTTRDPQLLYVDFEDGQIPAGWQVGETWSVAEEWNIGNLMAHSQSDTGIDSLTALVTPLLAVAQGEALTFEASSRGNDAWYPPTLLVSYSADGETWTAPADLTDRLSGTLQPFVLDTIPEGEWYLRFDGINVNLDNLFGYRLSDVQPEAHTLRARVICEDSVAIVGALVRLTNGALAYEAETDERGAFELRVTRADRDYAVTITHPDCYAFADSLTFGGQDIDTLFIVPRLVPVGIHAPSHPGTSPSSSSSLDAAYDLAGRRHPSTSPLRPGLYVRRGKKVVVRK